MTYLQNEEQPTSNTPAQNTEQASMFKEYLTSFDQALKSTEVTDTGGNSLSVDHGIRVAIDSLLQLRQNKGMLYMVGNGGSSGIISHAAVDLINECKIRTVPITDNSLLTCMANDYGYEHVFREPLTTLLTSEDAVIATSGSGRSPNVINAVKLARERGAMVITFTGFDSDNPLRQEGELNFWINARNYGKVELGYALLLHIITDELPKRAL